MRSDAGIGSNFIGAIDWFWYSQDTNTPVYIDWDEDGNNFFNDLFIQKVKPTEGLPFVTDTYYAWSPLFYHPSNTQTNEIRYKKVPLYKKYDKCLVGTAGVYYEPEFKNTMIFLHNVYKNNLEVHPRLLEHVSPLENTLAVHIRMIGLYFADKERNIPLHTIISEEEYYKLNLEQMKSKFENGKYDYIYLGCDDKKFFDICVAEFKDKLIYQDYERNLYHNSINRYKAHAPNAGIDQRPSVSEEYSDAMIDILLLASCKDFLGCVSSFTFSTLIINPYCNFDLFKTTTCGYTG